MRVPRSRLAWVKSFRSECVVDLLLSLVAKDLISVVDLLEFLGCSFFVASRLVGVAFLSQLVKRFLDACLVAFCWVSNPETLVEVLILIVSKLSREQAGWR